MSKGTVLVLVVLGCILLAVANVALWASLNVFNPERFGREVARGLQTDQASEALANEIVARVMASYPDFPPLAQVPAKEVITWLLQRPAFTPVLEKIGSAANVAMTTNVQEKIGVDLSTVVPQIVGVVTAINPEIGANVQSALEASKEGGLLSIYESGQLPRLRAIANTVPWLWPLAGLGAIALFVASYVWAVNRKNALTAIGIGILVVGVLELLLIPALRAPIQNNITNSNLLVVVGEVLNVVMRGLVAQSIILILIGAMVLVARVALAKRIRPSTASQ